MDFWQRVESLVNSSRVVVDRPAGTRHPTYPDVVYPLDYGYLDGVPGGDGQPIDLWRGQLEDQSLVGVVCTADTLKRDGEFKLLLGCSESEIRIIEQFHTNQYMSCLVIMRPARS
jgi:inorganic pyrophosphatase